MVETKSTGGTGKKRGEKKNRSLAELLPHVASFLTSPQSQAESIAGIKSALAKPRTQSQLSDLIPSLVGDSGAQVELQMNLHDVCSCIITEGPY